MKRARAATLLALAALASSLSACGSAANPQRAVPVTTIAGPYDYDYMIPEGTAALIARGDDPGIMPASLDVRVGDTIRIVNQDSSSHMVGTLYVLAGSTLTYRFSEPGVFAGECSTNPAKSFVLTVEA
jgi:plastocyanin